MSEIFSIPCPACGEILQITDENSHVLCSCCGTEHAVYRDGEDISLEPVTQEIMNGDNADVRMNDKKTLARLKKEKDELIARKDNLKSKDCKGYIFTWIGRAMFVVAILVIYLMRSSPFRPIIGGIFIALGFVFPIISNVLCSKEMVTRHEKLASEINQIQTKIKKLEEKLNDNE
ncbi:MAG: hypothetical protein JXC36_09305 [Candidatus Atribacteria bacterium]|nr:hypothetical protein [Candidatus Atribacteria bacterium]